MLRPTSAEQQAERVGPIGLLTTTSHFHLRSLARSFSFLPSIFISSSCRTHCEIIVSSNFYIYPFFQLVLDLFVELPVSILNYSFDQSCQFHLHQTTSHSSTSSFGSVPMNLLYPLELWPHVSFLFKV